MKFADIFCQTNLPTCYRWAMVVTIALIYINCDCTNYVLDMCEGSLAKQYPSLP